MKKLQMISLFSLILISFAGSVASANDDIFEVNAFESFDVAAEANSCEPALATITSSGGRYSLRYDQAEFDRNYKQLKPNPGERLPSPDQLKAEIQSIAEKKLSVFSGGNSSNLTITIRCSFRPLRCTVTVAL